MYRTELIALNQDIFSELLIFVKNSEKFTLGFLEINFYPHRGLIVEELKVNPQCEEIQFVVLEFTKPSLRFLLDEITKELSKIEKLPNKKLVLIIQGLENSIWVWGEYPPVLVYMNFHRDAFKTEIPYPIIFILPNYALKRLARFAPDFWDWRSGVFNFNHGELWKKYLGIT